MRKSIVAIGLLILLFIPICSQAAEFLGTYLYSYHTYEARLDGTTPLRMLGVAYVSESDKSVYVFNAPGSPGPEDVLLYHPPNGSGWDDPSIPYYCFVGVFERGEGWPGNWEDRGIYFWIDNDGAENPSVRRSIPSGSLKSDGLPFVKDVQITGGSDFTVSWTGTGDDDTDGYKIRLFSVEDDGSRDPWDLLFESTWIPKNDDDCYQYSYTDEDNLFASHGGELAITIDAYDFYDGYGLANQSRYVVNHVVPIPSTLLLFGGGLVGVFGLRRRKKGKASS